MSIDLLKKLLNRLDKTLNYFMGLLLPMKSKMVKKSLSTFLNGRIFSPDRPGNNHNLTIITINNGYLITIMVGYGYGYITIITKITILTITIITITIITIL